MFLGSKKAYTGDLLKSLYVVFFTWSYGFLPQSLNTEPQKDTKKFP